MGNFSKAVFAGLMGSSFAHAMVAPNFEKPVMTARLKATGDTATSNELRALALTMNQRRGAEAATSFTLLEDTGIRCFRAPCPSTKNTTFVVTGVHASFRHGDSVRYEAREVLVNIPPNVRIVPRKLELTESSMELVAPGGGGFIRRTLWDLEIERFGRPTQTYAGEPKVLGHR